MNARPRNKAKRRALALLAAALLLAAAAATVATHNRLRLGETQLIRVPHGTTYPALLDTLAAHGCLQHKALFNPMARLRGLRRHISPGCYRVEDGASMAALVQRLYAGRQDPVRLTLGKHRTAKSLCDYIGAKLEMSGDSLLRLLGDSAATSAYGHTPHTIIALFVPNTYEVYWTLSPQALLRRMAQECDRFWTPQRRAQCERLGLTPTQATTLASIVEEETNRQGEKPLIASVYLNRLRKGMRLQADPTVRFANGDFSVRRIGGAMLQHPSPYNTYLYPGLPPGPICTPSIASIDAVLAGTESPYLYFCANADFSGSHVFATTLSQHRANAARFHRALSRRGIRTP